MPLYDFNLQTGIMTDVTGTESIGPIELRVPTFESLEFMDPQTFEGGELAIAAIAGVAIIALVAGGAYLVFTTQRTIEMAAGGISMGLEAGGEVAKGASGLASGFGNFLRDIIP